MKRGQISIDLLFAVTLVSLTMLSLVSIATQETVASSTLDATAKLKVFSIDLRDTIVKAYSLGTGFSVQKRLPFILGSDDEVRIILNSTNGNLVIYATLDGRSYNTTQRIAVPITRDSSITLYPNDTTFWISIVYNKTEGTVNVLLTKTP